MGVRKDKKMNFKRIYSQIAKYGRTIRELSEEYGMDEESFLKRLLRGLDPKLYAAVIKANERNLKKQKNNDAICSKGTTAETTVAHKQEEDDMTGVKAEGKKLDCRQSPSNNNQETTVQTSRNLGSVTEDMSVFESKRASITGEISDEERKLNEATQILSIREETVAETQQVLDKAQEALNEAQLERDKAKNEVAHYTQSIEVLKTKLAEIETQITRLKNKTIYLVAPGYTGKKPEFGTFYSTTKVNGYETLSVVRAEIDYAIEPELKDMIFAGYDSYKEYMEGLRFVMLCVEFTFKGTDYHVLEEDERLRRLLKTHIG